ncbi:hypothetical protein ACHAXR_003825 [Thalassiosira sp. AJA248-18]
MDPNVLDREHQEMGKCVLSSNITEIPYVLFCNGERRLIRPQPFSKEFKDIGIATRWQIPLTLAWAMSIHKSQGMTIELLHVNLADCFAIGQAYVACSRGKCLTSMTVKNFKPTEIKTSSKVKAFYRSVNISGKPYTGGFWSDTITEFDENTKKDLQKKSEMKKHYDNSTQCKQCGLSDDKNNNQGKFYISCPKANGEYGHTWEFCDVAANTNNGNQLFRVLGPGVDGAIEDMVFEDKRFVLTGVFPELGGGEGTLKLGKDKMKTMIESFGGKVTTGLSGKTNCVIVGIEPGAKRLEDAKKKGVPTMDRFTLHKVLLGEKDLPAWAQDASQPTKKKYMKSTGVIYEC